MLPGCMHAAHRQVRQGQRVSLVERAGKHPLDVGKRLVEQHVCGVLVQNLVLGPTVEAERRVFIVQGVGLQGRAGAHTQVCFRRMTLPMVTQVRKH